jgi:hypothetical protein
MSMIFRDCVHARVSRCVVLAIGLLSVAVLPAWAQKTTTQVETRDIGEPSGPSFGGYFGGRAMPEGFVVTALPPEAQGLLDRAAAQDAQAREEMQGKLSEHRAALIQGLKELQDRFTKAGQLDEAVAVRDRVRQLEAAASPRPGPMFGGPVRAPVIPDPGNLTSYRDRVGQTFNFEVTGSTHGAVWGDGTYTDDSSLAAAAVHAGTLQPGQHGVVRVAILPGRDQYEGSERNGVSSAPYGAWPGSYRVQALRRSRTLRAYPTEPPLSDPGRLSDYRDRVGQTLFFNTTGSDVGTIWGSGVYTDDSPLAAAAVHAGQLKVGEQGVVRVTILPGQESYEGSTQNGITTQPYGPFPGSYRVERGPVTALPPGARSEVLPGAPAQSDLDLSAFRNQPSRTIIMPIVGSAHGSVWGSDVYTDDSSIAAAAVHAGVLREGEKGVVEIITLPGQESYAPSTRNGITSGHWDAWPGSFRIERHGSPADLDLKYKIRRLSRRFEPAGGGMTPDAARTEKEIERF